MILKFDFAIILFRKFDPDNSNTSVFIYLKFLASGGFIIIYYHEILRYMRGYNLSKLKNIISKTLIPLQCLIY